VLFCYSVVLVLATNKQSFDGASMMLVVQDNGKGDDDEFGDFCFRCRWYTL